MANSGSPELDSAMLADSIDISIDFSTFLSILPSPSPSSSTLATTLRSSVLTETARRHTRNSFTDATTQTLTVTQIASNEVVSPSITSAPVPERASSSLSTSSSWRDVAIAVSTVIPISAALFFFLKYYWSRIKKRRHQQIAEVEAPVRVDFPTRTTYPDNAYNEKTGKRTSISIPLKIGASRTSSLVVEESNCGADVHGDDAAARSRSHSISRHPPGDIPIETGPTFELPRRVRFEQQDLRHHPVGHPHDRSSMERQVRTLQRRIAALQAQINVLVAESE